jgi:hypothetical protein
MAIFLPGTDHEMLGIRLVSMHGQGADLSICQDSAKFTRSGPEPLFGFWLTFGEDGLDEGSRQHPCQRRSQKCLISPSFPSRSWG